MDEYVDIARHRMAAALALTGAVGLVAITIWCVRQAWPLSEATPAAMTSTVFLTLAGAASARLSVACLLAAHQLHGECTGVAAAQPLGAGARTRHRPPASRRRAASLFLAVAALIGPAAATAGATPLGNLSASTSARGALPDSGLGVGGPAAPDFDGSPNASDVAAPDFLRDAAALPTADGDRARSGSMEVFGARGTQECAAPSPGWLPPARQSGAAHCRLVLGAGAQQTERTRHVVLRGETLWGIASAHLPQHSTAEQVAAALPLWLEANPGLSSHPDLLHAGDALAVPTSFTTGATR